MPGCFSFSEVVADEAAKEIADEVEVEAEVEENAGKRTATKAVTACNGRTVVRKPVNTVGLGFKFGDLL